jgi:hypothetical protein
MDTVKEISVSRSEKTIVGHKFCWGRGFTGWALDGTAIPCRCATKVILKAWKSAFGEMPIKQVQFTETNIVARA